MNTKTVALAIALSCSFAISASGVQAKAAWNDVRTGFALAKKEHKPIIADVYTDWCGWCKKMERSTFENPGVEQLMSDKFVMVKVNAEDGGAGEQLAKQNSVNGYPTILFFDSDGAIKSKLVGYQDAPAFTAVLNSYLGGNSVSNDQQ